MFFLFWSFNMSRQQHISFLTTPQGNMWYSTTPVRACLLPFEQFIGQQMVQFKDSISKYLHYHIFSNMFFDETFEAHCAQILSCSGLGVDAWLTTWLIFQTFQLLSLICCIDFHMWFGLPHPLIACIPWCVCTHLVNPMGINFLCYVHGNEHIGTHDVICNTFVVIAQDACFHMGQEQLHVFLSTTFNSSCWWVNIVFTKDDIYTLADVVIIDPMRADLPS